MGFFDDLPPPSAEPDLTPNFHRDSHGPPQGWVGGWVPWHVVLSRGDDHYVFLSEVTAYPTGAELAVVSRVKPQRDESVPAQPEAVPHLSPQFRRVTATTRSATLSQPKDPSNFGVGFADGRIAVPWTLERHGLNPHDPVLRTAGGEGREGTSIQFWWLWPLPPPGPLTFAFSWPAHAVDETLTVLDATELVNAAEKVERLWS